MTPQELFPDSIDVVDEPGHAERVQLLVKELDAQLTGQQRHVFYEYEIVS